MPALGTHFPMTEEECKRMFGDIPFDRFIEHNRHNDVVTVGTVPGEYLSEITEGIWTTAKKYILSRTPRLGYG